MVHKNRHRVNAGPPLPAPKLTIMQASSFPSLRVVGNQVGGGALDQLADDHVQEGDHPVGSDLGAVWLPRLGAVPAMAARCKLPCHGSGVTAPRRGRLRCPTQPLLVYGSSSSSLQQPPTSCRAKIRTPKTPIPPRRRHLKYPYLDCASFLCCPYASLCFRCSMSSVCLVSPRDYHCYRYGQWRHIVTRKPSHLHITPLDTLHCASCECYLVFPFAPYR